VTADRVPEYEPPDTGSADALTLDFAELAHSILRLGEDVPVALDEDDTTETVVQLLADLRRHRKALHDLEAFVEAAAVQRIPFSKAPQRIGDQLVEVRGSKWTRTRWNHPSLARAVCADLIYDQETGAVNEEMASAVGAVADRILAAGHIDYWRATLLRQDGIDPDAFSEQVLGRRTVQLTPAVDEAVS
jgi:hypothetical protein